MIIIEFFSLFLSDLPEGEYASVYICQYICQMVQFQQPKSPWIANMVDIVTKPTPLWLSYSTSWKLNSTSLSQLFTVIADPYVLSHSRMSGDYWYLKCPTSIYPSVCPSVHHTLFLTIISATTHCIASIFELWTRYKVPQDELVYCHAPVNFRQMSASDWSIGLCSLYPQPLIILLHIGTVNSPQCVSKLIAYHHTPVIFSFLRQNPTLGAGHCLTKCFFIFQLTCTASSVESKYVAE